jgi:hypothetical protein
VSRERILKPTGGQAERKPPSTTTSEPVMNEEGKKCNGVCYFAWIAWALAASPVSEICLKPVPKGGIYVLARMPSMDWR